MLAGYFQKLKSYCKSWSHPTQHTEKRNSHVLPHSPLSRWAFSSALKEEDADTNTPLVISEGPKEPKDLFTLVRVSVMLTFPHGMHFLHIFLKYQAGFTEDTAAALAHLGCQERAFAPSALARGKGRVSRRKLRAICSLLGSIRSLLRSVRNLLHLGFGGFILWGGKRKNWSIGSGRSGQRPTCFLSWIIFSKSAPNTLSIFHERTHSWR